MYSTEIVLDLDEDEAEDETSNEIDEEKRALLNEQRQFEVEACKSIWEGDFKAESDSKMTIKLPLDKYFSFFCLILIPLI